MAWPKELVIASHNPGKLREIAELVRPYGVTVTSAGDLGLAEPEETGTSFEANALLKARASAEGSGRPALADDSGLCVTALGGDPGIYSARWAGPTKDFRLATQKVEAALDGKSDHSAAFVCVLALVWPEGQELVFEGRVEGQLVFPPRGERGFGYDPIFIAEGQTITFGEMDPAAKHAMSHRARAFAQLLAALDA
ncbi:MAG: RdgB/HAM1 family non-canonical purine NTP pyrophosphatase [Pseudomonadota bacterium]